MAEPTVPLPRMAALTLLLCEAGLGALSGGNGGAAPTAELRYVLGRLSAAAPATALRCPHVRAALPPDALAAAMAATRPAAQPPGPADSDTADPAGTAAPRVPGAHAGTLGATAAAGLLGVSPQAVRAAAGRGTLRGRKSRITGEWTFTRTDVQEYGRHGRA
jgi:hypothetical protein